jgi:hypothetical protein
VDSDLYKRALSYCENFAPTPQGSLLMRQGTAYQATWPDAAPPRLFTFPSPTENGDEIVAVGGSKVRYLRAFVTGFETFVINRVRSSQFDGAIDMLVWVPANTVTYASGAAKLTKAAGLLASLNQVLNNTQSTAWKIYVRIRGTGNLRFFTRDPSTGVAGSAGATLRATFGPTASYQTFSATFATGGSVATDLILENNVGADGQWVEIDEVAVLSTDGVQTFTEFASPWSEGQLDSIQFDVERSRLRGLFVNPAVQPASLRLWDTAFSCWELVATQFDGQPDWGTANWPGVLALGFQGRNWLGATPNAPAQVWGSKSGDGFDFTLGAGDADGLSFVASIQGAIRWLRGQKILLAGGESTEHSISGGGGALGGGSVITPSAIDVRDESAFGSAAVPGAHVGDQVLFVASDGKNVRAISYDLQQNGWTSRALTFVAEHIVEAGIRELHFSKHPTPTIIAVLSDGGLAFCTYDRSVDVLAWYRVDIGATVRSATVVRTFFGDDLWLSVTRGGAFLLERLPLYDNPGNATYVDSAVTGTVAAATFGGLSHLEGQTVRVLVAGATGAALRDDQVVTGGQITISDYDAATDNGKVIIVGLPYTATATTLPLEGGNPAGTSQMAKRRRPKVRLRLNESALPLVNGNRAPDRTPATPMGDPEPPFTGDVDMRVLGWSEDGAVTLEQDLPFRTEILALFSTAQVNEV